ncbi:MAG: hypothetical protein WBL67_12000 [Nitrososphaeraceae archaeon]
MRSTIGNNNRLTSDIIQEDKGGLPYLASSQKEFDEYSKFDSEIDGSVDEHLINQGATIIRSEITLTDSSGRNRTIVRR